MVADWTLKEVTVVTDGPDRKTLLKNVNMRFEPGKITLLVGRNGAGKSTLLETLAGLREVRFGEIKLGETPLWMKKGRLKRLNAPVLLQFGLSMQHSESQWFLSTARAELLYSMKPYKVTAKEAEQRIERAMASAGLDAELLERDPWTLSGGQQRRLSLACLLACEPEWLLLDEPTAGLDAVGIRSLCAVLEVHRAAGRGAVVVTHDIGALLPLADAVAVVEDGNVREAAPAAAAHAHAAAAPEALRALAALRGAAALPPQEPAAPARSGGTPWPSPREAAAAAAEQLARRDSGRAEPLAAAAAHTPPAAAQAAAAPSGRSPRADTFDPRALVAAYLLLAASLLAQRSLAALALAACVTALLLVPYRQLLYRWAGVIRAYAYFIVIVGAISGIRFRPFAFEWSSAEPTVLRLCQLLVVMLLGMPMLQLVTPLRLQRSIQQTFGWLARLHIPIHSFALLVTLIFRFIPLLAGEWERFAKLAHARGKAITPLRSVPVRMIYAVIVPYIRSIVRLAEQMADALEARGFGLARQKPTYGFRLRLGKPDFLLLTVALLASAIELIIAASL
ncbi:ATP-binding cassette domain-containing protein [Paenibacillus harenae]|uniref:ATP-binding cassette domain-containing protein n=1 Tax=Paenibacillus harenae TaxID=306543 RepID=UPI00278D1AEE|nr:ATP-binding cassette domain-containing protein [Paenibacillus harenae]MDQ0059754.1 energy-coupling factor transport system ATP-binding protein [Paenibacillus harenae]